MPDASEKIWSNFFEALVDGNQNVPPPFPSHFFFPLVWGKERNEIGADIENLQW